MQALVLAGGFGTRLRSRVHDVPKPMAPIQGRPFLAYLLDSLVLAGCERAVLATGYLHEVIESHFGTQYRGLPISYSRETSPLGTGGAVLRGLEVLPEAPTLVMNGDTWINHDMASFVSWASRRAPADAVLLRRVANVARYGAVTLDGERIVKFGEKANDGPGLINAGVYWLRLRNFQRFTYPNSFSLEGEHFQAHLPELDLLGQVTEADFIDIGVPEDYDRALLEIPRSLAA